MPASATSSSPQEPFGCAYVTRCRRRRRLHSSGPRRSGVTTKNRRRRADARPFPLVPPCLRDLHPSPQGQGRTSSKDGWSQLRRLPATVGWPSASSLTRVSAHCFQIGVLISWRPASRQVGTELRHSFPSLQYIQRLSCKVTKRCVIRPGQTGRV